MRLLLINILCGRQVKPAAMEESGRVPFLCKFPPTKIRVWHCVQEATRDFYSDVSAVRIRIEPCMRRTLCWRRQSFSYAMFSLAVPTLMMCTDLTRPSTMTTARGQMWWRGPQCSSRSSIQRPRPQTASEIMFRTIGRLQYLPASAAF